mgnify:CR=1 FL=1
MTVNIRHILHTVWARLSLCIAAIVAMLCVLTSCADESDADDGTRTVVLHFSTAKADATTATTRASVSTEKDDAVKDLTVLIFDSNGDVIGSNYGSYTIESSTSFSVSIKTRVAQGCTIYAFANVGTIINPNYFYGLTTKSEIDSKVYTMQSNNELNTQTCLLMMGELDNFDTSTKSATTVSLQRLTSKFDITITAKNDATNGSLPITIDGYQLFNVPSTTSLAQASTTVPTTYHDGDKVTLSGKTSSSTADATATLTAYLYGNPVGKNANATEWTKRNKDNLPTTPNGKCTFLRVWAHTAVWSSYYDVYLGGNELKASGSPTYDYTDYTIYPNYHYTVNITIQGSGAAENGCRVNYQANIMFNGATLNGWGKDVPIDKDMK